MLDTQREALEIIGIDVKKGSPGDNVKKLAEVMVAAVLAGELSLLSALASCSCVFVGSLFSPEGACREQEIIKDRNRTNNINAADDLS